MINFKKNHELFWILEVLLLTPLAFFWSGVVSFLLSGSSRLLLSVVGQPLAPARSILVTLICPVVAAFFAYEYLAQNKKENSPSVNAAKVIITVCIIAVVLIVFYMYGENRPR